MAAHSPHRHAYRKFSGVCSWRARLRHMVGARGGEMPRRLSPMLCSYMIRYQVLITSERRAGV